MKNKIIFPESGNYYKANLHCHSTISDGKLTIAQIKNLYKAKGYSVVAYSDHNKYNYHKHLNDDSFLALAAYEVDTTERGADIPPNCHRTFHFNLFDTDPETNSDEKEKSYNLLKTDYHDIEGINEFISRMNDLGFIVSYNHPNWSLQTLDDIRDIKGIFAMEIYNNISEVNHTSGFAVQTYDDMLRRGQRVSCIASDDNHNLAPIDDPNLSDSFGGFVYINAQKLEYKSVISALKNGNFYWSQGPQILGMRIKDNKLRIKTSPISVLSIIQQGRGCYKRFAPEGGVLREAEIELSGSEGYIRVQIQDAQGRLAGTRAYFIDEFK